MDGLKFLVDKLSQYNFVTNILPGTVLCIVPEYVVGYDVLLTEDWYILGILFYFVGMVNNRFGSVVVEPICRRLKLVDFVPYRDFVTAEKLDAKITILNTENNVFRSYISVCLLSALAFGYKLLEDAVLFFKIARPIFLLIVILVLMVLSYRKQTKYVKQRVEANLTNCYNSGSQMK